MFDCEQCSKSYLSQYALNRHMQNHNKTDQYTCNICHVTYSRRDLLARHEKIHRQPSVRATPLSGESALASASPLPTRLRRHTACRRCADQRKKCNGGDPCAACTRSGHKCVFPTARDRANRPSSGRQSTAVESRHHSDPQGTGQPPDTVFVPTLDLDQTPMIAEATGYPTNDEYSRLPTEPTQPQPAQLLDAASAPQLSLYTSSQFAYTSSADLYDIDSWVWLHENLYLQPAEESLTNIDAAVDQTWPLVNSRLDVFSRDSQHLQVISTPSTNLSSNAPGRAGDTIFDERQRLIDKIVSYAAMLNLSDSHKSDHGDYWLSVSEEIRGTFHITLGASPLQDFIDLYLKHFWPLWPVLAQQNLFVNRLHPLLYLVLVSIGAMYGDSGSVQFGRLLHYKIRTYLTVVFELDESDGDFTWLAQARLYTQVAALYFGQPKAFTYAQHLGALLVAQARRIELFSGDHYERAFQTFISLRNADQATKRLEIWLQLEARRRLAFGIFRVDTYTSILMDTRPLLSLDEIDMSFPYCDAVWRTTKMSIDTCLYMIDHDRTPGRHLRASDVYGIALDPDETLPILDPIAHELLLFGLQRSLGRFAYDHSALNRLTGSRTPVPVARSQSDTSGTEGSAAFSTSMAKESTQLPITPRRMHRLKQEFESMIKAQKKWEEVLPAVKNFVTEPADRSSLMSGLVLFHLGFLRLHAPIAKLHQLQYKLTENGPIDPNFFVAIAEWAPTADARLAAERSCELFSLVAGEALNVEVDHVKFNLLAFIALHHAVVILWCYAAACDGGFETDDDLSRNESGSTAPSIKSTTALTLSLRSNESTQCVDVRRQNIRAIINVFVELFNRVSPGKWSTFAEAAAPLARLGFPRQSTL